MKPLNVRKTNVEIQIDEIIDANERTVNAANHLAEISIAQKKYPMKKRKKILGWIAYAFCVPLACITYVIIDNWRALKSNPLGSLSHQ